MEDLLAFLQNYGWQLGLIAIAGILILGILKYAGMFKSVEEKYRHYIYLGISIGISVIAAIIYLACVGMLTFNYACVVAAAIYALNQTFYNIFDITPVNELLKKLLDAVVNFIKSKIATQTESDAADADTVDEDTADTDTADDGEE
ncbi:MAG: hypothetical protein LUD27_00710 [Clostridia bacterium]|nr:hypothetical protein [Clostridia bacterium]